MEVKLLLGLAHQLRWFREHGDRAPEGSSAGVDSP